MCTQAYPHACTHTTTLTLTPSPCPPPLPPASPACCQIKAWKAGHKRECIAKGAAEATDSSRSAEQQAARPTSTLTADQRRLLTTMQGLAREENWQGVVKMEREILALATTVGGAVAAAMHGALGDAFHGLGKYARAREIHEKHKAMAEALGDRAGVATACGSLGICYSSTGDYVRAREMHEKHKAMAEALGDRAGVAAACGHQTDRQTDRQTASQPDRQTHTHTRTHAHTHTHTHTHTEKSPRAVRKAARRYSRAWGPCTGSQGTRQRGQRAYLKGRLLAGVSTTGASSRNV